MEEEGGTRKERTHEKIKEKEKHKHKTKLTEFSRERERERDFIKKRLKV